MIDNAFLFLLVERLNALRHPGVNPEDSDLEQQYIDRLLSEPAPGERQWRDHALDAYVRLSRSDLFDLPLRTHHWFIERLAEDLGPRTVRGGFFADLYEVLDPVGRFLAGRLLVRSETGWREMEPIVRRVSEAPSGNRHVREFAELMLDIWLSEPPVSDARDGRLGLDRPIPWWLERLIRSWRVSAAWKDIDAVLGERAATLDPQTAAALGRLRG